MLSGEFLKILFAETSERTEIFRRVFDTDFFNKVTLNLNNRQKEVKEQLQELKIEFATISLNTNFEEKFDAKDLNECFISELLQNIKNKLEILKDEYKISETSLKNIEKDYKKIEDEYKEKIGLKKEIDNVQKDITIINKKISEFTIEERKSDKYSENLEIIKKNLKIYNEIFNKKNLLEERLKKVKEIFEFDLKCKENIKEYNDKENELKKISNEYLEKEDEFFREQAGILALKLEENKPCPVCGSCTHPNIAKISENVLSKNDLELLKNNLEQKQKNLNIVKEKITFLNAKIKAITDELKIEKNIEEEINEIENTLCEKNIELKNIYDIINIAYKEISRKKINIESFIFEKYEEEISTMIFKIKEKITKNKAIKDEKIKELEKRNKKIENIDFNELEEELKEKKKLLDRKKSDNLKLKMDFENTKNSLEKLEKLSDKLIKKIKDFNVLDELYKTASGTLPGKSKINFEQYIQTNYFDMVVQEANKRFLKMTDGRFQLLRKESSYRISDKIALELEVLDYYNGKRRDVKSLSGGEAFKASLSLALGLSDIIQSYSGGVRVDTLFIDEGFGSLDAESREQAIDTLNQLVNGDKLIGIISHVSELQERIDKKIIVEKGLDGSKVVIN